MINKNAYEIMNALKITSRTTVRETAMYSITKAKVSLPLEVSINLELDLAAHLAIENALTEDL